MAEAAGEDLGVLCALSGLSVAVFSRIYGIRWVLDYS